MERIAHALGGTSAPQAVFDLAKANGARLALKDIGMNESDLDRACAITLQNQYPNPRPPDESAIRQLLQDAYEGRRPQI